MSEGTYVIAGGSTGIGLELVRQLTPIATRIDVWSREVHDLQPVGVVRHAPLRFQRWRRTAAGPT